MLHEFNTDFLLESVKISWKNILASGISSNCGEYFTIFHACMFVQHIACGIWELLFFTINHFMLSCPSCRKLFPHHDVSVTLALKMVHSRWKAILVMFVQNNMWFLLTSPHSSEYTEFLKFVAVLYNLYPPLNLSTDCVSSSSWCCFSFTFSSTLLRPSRNRIKDVPFQTCGSKIWKLNSFFSFTCQFCKSGNLLKVKLMNEVI